VGEVPFKVDEKGRTIFEAQKNAYSYRVTRPAGWREPDVADYAQAAVSARDSVVAVDEKICRRLPMPYLWRKGMVRRGANEEVPVEASTGARIDWSGMANEGVWRATLSFHPPFKGGTGYVFAKYRIKIPKEGAAFSAKIAKGLGSVRGDGVLFRTLVREGKNGPLECVAERVIDDYVWHDFKADLSRWAGRTVDLYLVGDPGTSNNTYGDSGGWADLHLECLKGFQNERLGDSP